MRAYYKKKALLELEKITEASVFWKVLLKGNKELSIIPVI
jgi:hypothetical protein